MLIVWGSFNQSSTPNFLIAHLTTSLRTQSNAFSISIKAKKSFFFFSQYLSCTWCASTVPLTGMKANCIASMSTTSQIVFYVNLSKTFTVCSNNFNPPVASPLFLKQFTMTLVSQSFGTLSSAIIFLKRFVICSMSLYFDCSLCVINCPSCSSFSF